MSRISLAETGGRGEFGINIEYLSSLRHKIAFADVTNYPLPDKRYNNNNDNLVLGDSNIIYRYVNCAVVAIR